jgi:hypothetical protein
VTSRGSVIQSVRCHHFIFEALPELFHALLHALTLERVEVFDHSIVLRGPLKLEPRLLLGCFPLVGICVEEVEDPLVIQLDVGA